MTNPNESILNEVNAAKTWFHAKKVKPLWAKEATEDGRLESLESENQTYKQGDFICRGEAGDLWPQSASSLNKKYEPTEEVDSDGWRKYLPIPDSAGVMAAQIDHAFMVITSWGDLEGAPGDYLVKNAADEKTEFPEDCWVVSQKIFNSTYQATELKS